MSHKHRNNYTQYSKMSGEDVALTNNTEIPEAEPVDDACGLNGCGFVENESASIEQPVEGQITIPEIEPEPTIKPVVRKIGKVSECSKLKVRKLPSPDAKVVGVIDEGAEVMIDADASTLMFYKVCTECGIEGYCMKKFITVQ